MKILILIILAIFTIKSFAIEVEVDKNLEKQQKKFQERVKNIQQNTQYFDLKKTMQQNNISSLNELDFKDTIILDLRDQGENEDTYFKTFPTYIKISLGNLEATGIKQGILREHKKYLLISNQGVRAALAYDILFNRYSYKYVLVLKGGEESIAKEIEKAKAQKEAKNDNSNKK